MSQKPTNPLHQPETEFDGEVQTFTGPALPPDDPNLEPRVRKGRPGQDERSKADKKNTPAKD
jgi:hypothetical protein